MISIWQILTHTPWWVFVLFLFLLKIGIDATKLHIVCAKKLFLLPVIFLIISINTLFDFFPMTPSLLFAYVISLSIGFSIGWMIVRNLELSFDHIHHLIKIPGSCTPLMLMLSVFSAKYYFGYSKAIHPELIQQIEFILFQLILSGVCTGLFLGRLTCYLFRKNRTPHENLKEITSS